MKTVYLVRHGKASERELDVPDLERTLTDRGIKDSSTIGRRLRKEGVKPSIIVSSSAPRAFQTARLVAKQFGIKKKDIVANEDMCEQENDALLNVLHGLNDEHETVILVGHNPSFVEFARFLVPGFTKELPTCGVIGIRCNVDSWKEVGPETGEEISYIAPGIVPQKTDYSAIKKEIEKSLAEGIEHVLMAYEVEPVKKVKKAVEDSAQVIAKKFVRQLKKTSGAKK